MADKKIVAIDFGTSNTYISKISDSGKPEPVILDTGGGDPVLQGIQTVVLYHDAGPSKGEVTIGRSALEEYLGTNEQDRQIEGMRLSQNFKPDIGFSDHAREDAVAFLKELLTTAKNANRSDIIPSKTNNVQVIIGIPSEASRDGNARTKGAFSEALLAIAEQAGWGKVRLLDEPFGPLFYEYRNSDIRTAREHILEDDFLVIDFGGGTCDFTVLSDGKIKNSWGDMCLGGRLFDDLFYQWTLEVTEVPGYNEKKHIQDSDDGYFRDILCRSLKEDFSNYMIAHGKKGTWVKPNPYICKIGSPLRFTWDEFIQRAKKYKSSESFCQAYKDLLNVNPLLTDFKMGQEVDLLAWFENALLKGLQKSGVASKDIDRVLLAGGSSAWFFVKDICIKLFSEEKCKRSDNVFEAIASGIAAYANIKKEAENNIRKLEISKETLINRLYSDTINSLKINSTSPLIKNLGTMIFDELAIPILKRFAKNGGAMKDLEKEMESFVRENPEKINRWLSSAMKDTTIKVNQHVNDELIKWFNEHGVPATDFRCQDADLPIFKMNQTNINPFSSGTKWLEFGVVSLIFSALCAAIFAIIWALGGVAALLAAIGGPLAAAGAIFAILIAYFTTGMSIREAIEKFPLPAKLTSWLISGDRIEKMRGEFLKKFSEEFPDTYNKLVNDQSNNIKQAVQKVVDNELKRYKKILEMEG